jgi:flagellar biosynthesis/type III secretory pathway chaperone
LTKRPDTLENYFLFFRGGSMDSLINELTSVLEQEAKLYNELLAISKNKTPVLVEGKVTELENIVKVEQSLVLQMSKLEDQRENLIGKISEAAAVKPEELTVTELIRHVDREQGEKLEAAKNDILNATAELGNANQLNIRLINNSLDFINFSMNLIVSPGSEDNNYNVGAEKSRKKTKSLLDLKI